MRKAENVGLSFLEKIIGFTMGKIVLAVFKCFQILDGRAHVLSGVPETRADLGHWGVYFHLKKHSKVQSSLTSQWAVSVGGVPMCWGEPLCVML